MLLTCVAVKLGRLCSGVVIDGAFTDTFDTVMLVLYTVKVFDDTMLEFDTIMAVVDIDIVFEKVCWVGVKFELSANTVFCVVVTIVCKMKVEFLVTILVELSRVDVMVKFGVLDTAAVILREEKDALDTVAVAVIDASTILEEFITAVKEPLNIFDDIR